MKTKKYVVMNINKETNKKYFYHCSDDNNYTDNINDAFVYYSKADAKGDITDKGDKVMEVITRNFLVNNKEK